MNPWKRLLTNLGIWPGSARRYYELDEPLQAAVLERADRDQRPFEQVEAELLSVGLAHLQSSDRLQQRWDRLSKREQDVTALTCLNYTNRQIAAYLQVSPATVKSYVRQSLSKWQVHSKDELRMLLEQWQFDSWGPPLE
jgi:DNA-binding CsgD family transcriptional regulator